MYRQEKQSVMCCVGGACTLRPGVVLLDQRKAGNEEVNKSNVPEPPRSRNLIRNK